MKRLTIPKDYEAKLSLFETEVAIKELKDFFQVSLSEELSLTRVSAPLFVRPESGLNDDLNGIETAVSFTTDHEKEVQIVHSLAKWKRMALHRYGMKPYSGLYADMNAIRKCEELSNIHSLYVDQWDWEKIIAKEDRTPEKLEEIVRRIYRVFRETDKYITKLYPTLTRKLPEDITFVSSQELEDRYPAMTSKEREDAAAKEYGAIFITKIGHVLKSGEKHDGRAPDYDDWELNGDIIFWNPVLERALELSSMGIRVDEESLASQLEIAGCTHRKDLPFHRMLLEGTLPYTVGGGIGQSRICMFFLEKAHIGEVQSSLWPAEMSKVCEEAGIELL